jgi:large subunit ribosomal protein L13
LSTENSSPVYVDGAGHIAGRLASVVTRELLAGRRVTVVNAEKILISGERGSVVNQWKKKLEITSRVNPLYGPIHHRRPDGIMRRMVRGMVPRRKTKGVLAMKRLRVYIGVPESLAKAKLTRFDEAAAPRPPSRYMTLGELGKNIGWSG